MSEPSCRICLWSETEDGQWESTCNEIFEFTDCGPEENGFKFCPYCGAELVPIIYQPAKVEADEEEETK